MYDLDSLFSSAIKLSKELKTEYKNLSDFEALQIATRIQRNHILAESFAVSKNQPSAIERIAIELGADKSGDSIKSAIFALAEKGS